MKKCIAAVVTVVMTHAAPLSAQDRLQADFTFKRVGVPTSGASRITVQVTPRSPASPASPGGAGATNASAPVIPRVSELEWFWGEVPTARDASGAARIQQALKVIANPPSGKSIPAPRLQALQDIANAHGLDILRETVGTEVSPALVLAVIAVESAGRTGAQSHAGAQGLMQLMPDTAARFGVTDSLNPSDNIKGGVAYLAWLQKHFDNDAVLVLAGYNAGEGSVRDNDGVPPYAETRGYVPKVLAAWSVAKGLCVTPPQLLTDGCVFNVNNS